MTVADAIRAAGVTVHDARVPPRPGGFDPEGVLWHHVGDMPPKALAVPPPALKLVQQGRPDLPGPLCQWLVDGEGGWWWITDGRANHAGGGDADVRNWLNSDGPRPPDPPRPNGDTTTGNGYLIGVEVEGNGHWSAKVHDSMLRATRALLDFYALRDDNLIAHKEWTTRKPDPAGIDMPAARRALLTPEPTPPGGKDMLGPKLGDKTGADASQVINIDGVLYIVGEGASAAAYDAAKVETILIGASDYQKMKKSAVGADS